MKEFRNPATLHQPVAAYTHQIEIRGPERMLVLSGQVGMRPDGSVPSDPVAQLDVALANIQHNLAAAQMDAADLVKLTVYLVGAMDPAQRAAVIAARLGAHRPCMTLVYVVALASPGYKVEVDAWASRADG